MDDPEADRREGAVPGKQDRAEEGKQQKPSSDKGQQPNDRSKVPGKTYDV